METPGEERVDCDASRRGYLGAIEADDRRLNSPRDKVVTGARGGAKLVVAASESGNAGNRGNEGGRKGDGWENEREWRAVVVGRANRCRGNGDELALTVSLEYYI